MKKKHRRVRAETAFTKWFKMLALYVVWYWIAFVCPMAAFWPLFFNDGGVFHNECYYMFYNGVVWYKPPERYVRSNNIFGNGELVSPV